MSIQGAQALSYAVRPRVLARLLGQLALVLLVVLAVPAAVALLDGEGALAARFAAVIAVLAALGLPALRLPAPDKIQHNEALTVAALAFVIAPLALAYPFGAVGLGVSDALFEAVSGVTTTGLSVLGDPGEYPPAFLFARAWAQWFGGLGIVVLSVGLLMGSTVAARRLTESTGGEVAATTARAYARRMLVVYAVLTAVAAAVLWPLLGADLAALSRILSAVSTGGFSPGADSLAAVPQWWLRFAVMAFCFAGALPLVLWSAPWRRDWRQFAADLELRALLVACVLIGAALSAVLYFTQGMAASAALQHGFLVGISAQTGTGFTSLEVAGLDPLAKAVLLFPMALGGGVASTAGGIKLLRLLIVLRFVQLVLRRTAMTTHAVGFARLSGRRVDPDDLSRALLLIVLFVIATLVSWLAFVAHGYAPLDALFEVVSALGTVGLSTGITASDLAPALKAVLCVDMLLGRLEFVALLVLFYPPTWIGKRA